MQPNPETPIPLQLPQRERWLEALGCLFPHTRLVATCAPSDPAHALGLPDDDPPEDAGMVSAYYLSFYE